MEIESNFDYEFFVIGGGSGGLRYYNKLKLQSDRYFF